jgi:RNA polymerase sigma-70 factor, ECF subfamily
VLEAIYGAYALDWLVQDGERDMSNEALYLARLLAQLLPNEPEIFGLAALIAIANARMHTRLRNGALIPLHEQDHAQWNSMLLKEGSDWLRRAAAFKQLGRFQLEAAIQQAHVSRVQDRTANWPQILMLSEALCLLYPTAGAHANRIAALSEVKGPQIALSELEKFAPTLEAPFQPLEATRASLLMKLERFDDARTAYAKAISLAPDPATRAWLTQQSVALRGN